MRDPKYVALTCLMLVQILTASEGEKYPPPTPAEILRATYALRSIESLLKSAQTQIELIKKSAFGVKNIEEKIKKIEGKIKKLKDEYKITPLEEDVQTFDEQLFAVKTAMFAKALKEYIKINRIIKNNIFGNEMIKQKLKKIQELQVEIMEYMEKAMKKIKELGKKIDEKTEEKEQPEALQTINKAEQLEQALEASFLDPKFRKKVNPLENKIVTLKNEIEEKVGDLPPTQREKIRRLKDLINQIKLLLLFTKNPMKIRSISAEEIIGAD